MDACIPSYNNASTLEAVIASVRGSTVPIARLLVIDDGSTDGTAECAENLGVETIRLPSNQGRGAARKAGVDAITEDLFLSIDGTCTVAADFAARCLPWFEDANVAAVFGRLTQPPPRTTAERWRGRHLYKVDEHQTAGYRSWFMSGMYVARASAFKAVGNFDASLRASEDFELGSRLISSGWKIVYEPAAVATTLVTNSTRQVLERYWRWHAGVTPRFSLRSYAKEIIYSIKVLARLDLKKKDFGCAWISFICPHFCAFRSMKESRRNA